MRAPVAANGWPKAMRRAFDVELRAVDRAERLGAAEPSGSSRGPPRPSRSPAPAPRRPRESRSNRSPAASGRRAPAAWRRRWSAPSASPRRRRNRRPRLRVGEIGLHRQAALRRPLLGGEQHRGGAVGQRRRVGGGDGAALGLVEGGLQLAIFSSVMSSRRLLSRNTPAQGMTRSSMKPSS